MLRNHGQQVWRGGKRAVVGAANKPQQRQKPRYYDEPVLRELSKLWQLLDYICGKRLVAIMPELIAKLELFGELRLARSTKEKLLQISASSIDRLLQPERRKQQLRGRSRTKPGTLLKHQIPIRTFAEWDEQQPGFAEIDLVAHDGGLALGDFCQTLDLTDICTGWTELEAVPNKAQVWVFEAIQKIRERLPFPLLGLDSDNGSEFINGQLLRYCQQQRISFTRARPYRKNDNCYVEQKNYSVVRQTVGYQRFRHDGGVAGVEAVVCAAAVVHQFFSTHDEAEKQRAARQSGEEELPHAPNSLPTSVGCGAANERRQKETAATISIIKSGRLETRDR